MLFFSVGVGLCLPGSAWSGRRGEGTVSAALGTANAYAVPGFSVSISTIRCLVG